MDEVVVGAAQQHQVPGAVAVRDLAAVDVVHMGPDPGAATREPAAAAVAVADPAVRRDRHVPRAPLGAVVDGVAVALQSVGGGGRDGGAVLEAAAVTVFGMAVEDDGGA